MSENQPPSEERHSAPPVQNYANYPRTTGSIPVNGSIAKLQALMEGYYGIGWSFLAMVGFVVLALVVLFAAGDSSYAGVLFAGMLVVALIGAGFVAYPNIKKIGFGLGWKESTALWVSVILPIASCVTSPIIILIVLQVIAMAEIKNYGIKGGFFGLRKKDIKARIEQLRQMERGVDMNLPPT